LGSAADVDAYAKAFSTALCLNVVLLVLAGVLSLKLGRTKP
jgi:hypothetical protein